MRLALAYILPKARLGVAIENAGTYYTIAVVLPLSVWHLIKLN